jgi:hypothetical protein
VGKGIDVIFSANGGKLGENGVQISSKTVGTVKLGKNKVFRVDIENPNPSNPKILANIHIQNNANINTSKLYFNPQNKKLYVKNGRQFYLADRHSQELLSNIEIQKAVNKGLYYLGESMVF